MKIKLVLGLIFSGICIAFVLYRINFEQLVAALRGANGLYIFFAVIFLLLTQVIRSLRWQVLLVSLKMTRFSNLLSATFIGAMADMILPARIGDIIRAGVIGNRENLSKMSSLATIVTERIFDVLTILFIFLYIAIYYQLPDNANQTMNIVRTTGGIAAALCSFAVLILLAIRNKTDKIAAFIDKSLRFIPERLRQKIAGSIISFAAGLQSLKANWHLGVILVYSLLLWSAFAASNMLIMQALDFPFHVLAGFYILLFQVLGVTLPSSPGAIGVYHGAVVAGLTAYNISFEQALSAAILMHAAFFFPFISFGLGFLWRENLSFSEIRSLR